MNKEELFEKQLDSSPVYQGRLLKVYKDNIELPNGKVTTREYIKHPGAVAIVTLDENNNVIIEDQYRYPIHEVNIEIPAGKLDGKEEDPLSGAKRELQEETGITAANWVKLGTFIPTCAYSDEIIHLYLARQLNFGKQNLDEDEFLNFKSLPLERLIDMIMQGQIKDGKTQAAVLMAEHYLRKEK